jgi:hypothetical protein
MKKFFPLFLSILVVFTACTTPNSGRMRSEEQILSKYFNEYTKIEETSNTNISAALREYSESLYANRYPDWRLLIEEFNKFSESLKTNEISSTYPVIINSNDFKIVDGFLADSIIFYSIDQKVGVEYAPDKISGISIKFIIRINEHEYKKIFEQDQPALP